MDLPALAARLDSMKPSARAAHALAWDRRQQARLFNAAKGFLRMDLDSLVPQEVGVMNEVVHKGRNTLPAFRHFSKVFCRPEGRDELWGYNRTNALLETTVGPGYFITRVHDQGSLLVDYLRVPPSAPPSWPRILPNEKRLSRFVYAGTQDVLRAVSSHVCIGRAQKRGKWLPAWFVLVRQG